MRWIARLALCAAIVWAVVWWPRLPRPLAAFFVGMLATALVIGVAMFVKVRRESRFTSPEERADVPSQNLFTVYAALWLTFPLQVVVGLVVALLVKFMTHH